MRRLAWLLSLLVAAALACPLAAPAFVTPPGGHDRHASLEIVFRVPLDGDQQRPGAILALEDRIAEVPVSALVRDLYRTHAPRSVSRAIDAGRAAVRLTRTLTRVALLVLEHLSGADGRTPRSH